MDESKKYPKFTHISVSEAVKWIDKIVSDGREARILKERLGLYEK